MEQVIKDERVIQGVNDQGYVTLIKWLPNSCLLQFDSEQADGSTKRTPLNMEAANYFRRAIYPFKSLSAYENKDFVKGFVQTNPLPSTYYQRETIDDEVRDIPVVPAIIISHTIIQPNAHFTLDNGIVADLYKEGTGNLTLMFSDVRVREKLLKLLGEFFVACSPKREPKVIRADIEQFVEKTRIVRGRSDGSYLTLDKSDEPCKLTFQARVFERQISTSVDLTEAQYFLSGVVDGISPKGYENKDYTEAFTKANPLPSKYYFNNNDRQKPPTSALFPTLAISTQPLTSDSDIKLSDGTVEHEITRVGDAAKFMFVTAKTRQEFYTLMSELNASCKRQQVIKQRSDGKRQ